MERLQRLGTASIDLLQLHWWQYEHPGYIDALRELDAVAARGPHPPSRADQLRHRSPQAAEGVRCSNRLQPGLLLAARPPRRRATLASYCLANDVRILAFGTLAGGFLSERWLGQPEPAGITDWSKMKYKRFIDAAAAGRRSRTFLASSQQWRAAIR